MAKTGKKIRRGIILLGTFWLTPTLAWADARMVVAATPNPVPESESLQLSIEVIGADGPIFQPTFTAPDFTVIGSNSPNPSVHVEIVNGRQVMIRHVKFAFILMPKRAGMVLIQNIQVKAGSAQLRSEDLRVKVIEDSRPPDQEDESPNPAAPATDDWQTNASSGGKSANALPRFHSDFTVVASVNKQKAFVGEPIIAEYFIYDYGAIRSCCEIQKWPTFNGFVKDDLEIATRSEFEDVFMGGRPMRRSFIGRYALYGIKPGKFPLDKMQVKAKYVDSEDMGGNVFQMLNLRNGMHASQDVTLDIVPVPEANRPTSFGGAVGTFSMRLNADKTTLPQNTPLNLTLSFEGTGNFQAIDSVKIPLPPDFELYETSTNARGSAPIGIRRGLESQKSFQIVAIPRKAGKFEIAPYRWSFFNPQKSAYETLATQALTIEVTENTNTVANNNSYIAPSAPGATTVAPESEIRPLKSVNLLHQKPSDTWWKALLAALVLLNLALLARAVRAKLSLFGRLYRKVDPFARPRAELSAARRAPGSQWQSGVEDALYSIQYVLLGMNARGLPNYELEEAWSNRNLPAPLLARIQNVLQELARSRFSSTKQGSTDRGKVIAEVEAILRDAGRRKKHL